jgi:D-alanine-D-alanine ligase
MRVLVITGDHGLPDRTKWDGAYSAGDLELHRGMRDALESLPGHTFQFLTEHARLVESIAGDPPDLVINFCDTGFRNVAKQELHVPALLELYEIPYTGAAPAGIVLCYDKAVVRAVAQAHGIPVPDELYLAPDAPLEESLESWPMLIKPAQGDGSEGIRPDALVHDAEAARKYLQWFRRELPGRSALLQEYLPGPEYGLALIGNPGEGFTAFPPLEVDYSGLGEGLPPILAFESKTGPANPYESVRTIEARLAPERIAEMRGHAELLFERLQCRDYARFDFRTAPDGGIKLLEVNPNPAWSSQGKLAQMAAFGGKNYAEFLRLILDTARARIGL